MTGQHQRARYTFHSCRRICLLGYGPEMLKLFRRQRLIGVRFFSVAKPVTDLESALLILTRQIEPATRI